MSEKSPIDADTWQRVKQVFAETIAKPAAERLAFLGERCEGDTRLRVQVEELLSAHTEARAFMGSPTHDVEPVLDPESSLLERAAVELAEPEDVIDRYKLLQKIGEGGFGVVYMAEQEAPVRRKVALKIIKLGMDTRQVIARFEAERQALALMDHPNIARVLDAGATGSGRPYFVMELVKGIPITEYCDKAKLDCRKRLELFIQVCRAVQHAHQRGIIHRDLKPSNVLVTLHDGTPLPKVIDFGIAKATNQRLTERTLFTGFAQMVGTPLYMSPEQAELSGLDVDTRTDVYSLGVLLYELLTGSTPFQEERFAKASYDDIRHVILEEEPPTPSQRVSTYGDAQGRASSNRLAERRQLTTLLRGDLDWITMKALEKDRVRRYESSSALAADVERYLSDQPVEAGPPSRWYRAKKFARRNRVMIGVVCVIAVVLVGATTVSTWQAVRATEAKREAEDALEEAEVISSFLREIFRSPDPARDGRTVTVAEMLDRAAERLETDLADKPARQARLRLALAATFRSLGLPDSAVRLQELARRSLRATLGSSHPDTLEAMSALAWTYDDLARHDDALALREEVATVRKSELGPEHRDTLLALNHLAISYSRVGRRGEALSIREDVLASSRRLLAPNDPVTLASMNDLAISYFLAGRLDDALELGLETVERRRETDGPNHPRTIEAMSNLVPFYSVSGRLGEGLATAREVLKLSRETFGAEHSGTIGAMLNLASAYRHAGHHQAALALDKRIVRLREAVNGTEHPHTLDAQTGLANSYFEVGRNDLALEIHEKLLPLRCKVHGPEHPSTLEAKYYLAHSYFHAGRRKEALTLREELFERAASAFGAEQKNDIVDIMHCLADSYFDAGRYEEALDLREQALERHKAIHPEKHPDGLAAMASLASSYLQADRVDEALTLGNAVLELSRKIGGAEHPHKREAVAHLAFHYESAGRPEEALALRQAVVTMRRRVQGPEHPNTLAAMEHLALSYDSVGRTEDARALRSEIEQARAKIRNRATTGE